MGLSPFRTFILKTTNRCNIDCDYCYVFNMKDQAWRTLPPRLDLEVARQTALAIAQHVLTHQLPGIHIVFHGGEPLLAGPRHMEALFGILRQAIARDTSVTFELQTNGTLITEQWLDLFEGFGVAVGVSLDGPPEANDRHRLSHKGRSSAANAIRGIELLRTRPAIFSGLLAVVDLANDPVVVHDFLAGFDPPVIDFNLPHATYEEPPVRTDASVPEYGQWLGSVFDSWVANPRHQHTVRMLEDIVALSFGVRGSVETLGLAPADVIVVESDGSLETVDTLRSAEIDGSKLDLDVFHHTFDEALAHPKLSQRHQGAAHLAADCQSCPVVGVCGGGYLPHRYSAERGYLNPSVYCVDLEYLIRHIQRCLAGRSVTGLDGRPSWMVDQRRQAG